MKDVEEEDKRSSAELDIISRELKGNTLLVYWFMLRTIKPYSSREIQRMVGISSSSLALHHLNKLIDLDLVKTDETGQYKIARTVKPGLLSLFVGTGRLFIPRFVFYSIFSSVLLFSCFFLFWPFIDTVSRLLIVTLSIVSTIFWIESFRLWKIQPV